MVHPAANAAAPPPTLPPSVEEAYRRKCIQLRHRMKTVEEANDASRIRLLRMRRGIEKMRLERAFLLEQLSKRTSTNVEDSDGSPSPPPTPKEKPLRTKRGRRAPDFLQDQPDAASGLSHGNGSRQASFAGSANGGRSTSNPSNAAAAGASTTRSSQANGTSAPRQPRSGFDVFVRSMRSVLLVANRQKIKEGTYDVDQDLARKWTNLGADKQNDYCRRFEEGEYEGWEEAESRDKRKLAGGDDSDGEADVAAEAEDVEMGEESGEGERH
ncbi:hypothetical protein VE03_08052 [Pseudogymnoascus sp. 23342-1-I1]|nr:hypothetical protein VE03_08052 [Pseudogymnoascus sp. 23342-1-I1]